MKKISLCLVALFFINAANAEDHMPSFNEHWLRAAPPNATMMAAYGQLHNDTDHNMKLIGAYSPDFAMAEIHRTVIKDDLAKMIHQPQLSIDINHSLSFTPGGLHIMLMRPQKAIVIGDSIKICLVYQKEDKEVIQHLMFPVLDK